MPPKQTQIGDRLKAARSKLKLSQTDTAKAWNISKPTLQKWGQGQREPRGRALEQILKEAGGLSSPTISKSTPAKLQPLCGVLDTKPDLYLNNLLELCLDDILDRRVGELEVTTLFYDSLAEAKRVTKACDAFDRKVHEWRFVREGRKWAARNRGWHEPFERKEAA